MKRLLILFFSISFFASCTTITGDGNIVTQSHGTFDDFHTVIIGNMLSVNVNAVTLGNDKSVSITTDGNVHEYVIVTQKDQVLYIKVKKDYQLITEKLHVDLSTPNNLILKNIGFGDITVEGPEYSNVELRNSGSGKINVNTVIENIKVYQSGSGIIKLNEKIDHILNIANSGSGDVLVNNEVPQGIKMDNSGSGNISALKSKASSTLVNISGSGECSVEVIYDLSVNISGSGNVNYKGDPRIVKDITGSGNLTKL